MGDKKLSLAVTEELGTALDSRADTLCITTSEYLRRLAGLGLAISKNMPESKEDGFLKIVQQRPDGSQENVLIISDVLY